MMMRLPVELHTDINNSTKEVDDISGFISCCEEIIDSSWGRETALSRPVNSYRKDEEPPRDKGPFERRKPLSVPFHGSSADFKPKEGKTC